MAFQDLFADVMESAWPLDFQKVRPHGPSGDLKCDGYWRSRRGVFQCYGPVSMKESDVIKKIEDDFKGAIDHWQGKMEEWIFVHNNSKGLTAKVVQVLDDLQQAHPAIKIQVWEWTQAREQFDNLSDEAVVDLFGYLPTDNPLDQIEFTELVRVIEKIAKQEADPIIPLNNPPSVTKLEKNSLDEDSAAFLRVGRTRVRLVEEYFSQCHDPVLGDKIARAMQVQYQTLIDTGLNSNEVLVELQQFAGWGKGGKNSHDAAVLAVITYFFDRCDIFEDPNEDYDDSEN